MVISYFNYLWDIDGISAGSAIKAKEFVRALRRQGHPVHLEWRVPQPNGSTGEPMSSRLKNKLKPLLQNYLREPKILAANLPNLVKEYQILRQQKPDIFFPRLEYGNFSCLALSKILNLTTVVEADCPPTHEWQQFYAQDALRLGDISNRLEVATLNQADAVITQSNALSQYYIDRGVNPAKIHMIPNAADIRKFQPLPADEEIKARFDLQDAVTVGWVGAGVAWTGIDSTIASVHQLMQKYPQLNFLMIGSQKNMDYFGSRFADTDYADRIKLAGFVPHEQIPRYLSCTDIVMAPYPKFDFFYASSMKLFEYMAAGKAILATRVGQIAEVIDEGRNGFLFDPEKQGEFEKQLASLIEDPALRQKFGAQAREDAEKEWNWDRVGEKMLAVFESVRKN